MDDSWNGNPTLFRIPLNQSQITLYTPSKPITGPQRGQMSGLRISAECPIPRHIYTTHDQTISVCIKIGDHTIAVVLLVSLQNNTYGKTHAVNAAGLPKKLQAPMQVFSFSGLSPCERKDRRTEPPRWPERDLQAGKIGRNTRWFSVLRFCWLSVCVSRAAGKW